MYRFKRLNRGVAAGLIVLLVTCVYVYWDERSFQKDTDVIRGVVESYLKAGEQAAVYPEALQTMDRPLTNEEKKAIIDKSVKVVNEYWVDETVGDRQYSYRNKAGMLSGIRNVMFNEMGDRSYGTWSYNRTDRKGYVSKASFVIKEAKPVKKVAPKCAMFTVQLVRTYHFQGEIHTFGPSSGHVWMWMDKEEFDTYSQQLHTVTIDFEVDFYLNLTDDGWKIFETTGYGDEVHGSARPVNT